MESKLIFDVRVNVIDTTRENAQLLDISEVIGSKEASKIIGIHPTTLYNWRKKGKVKYRMVGRTCLYSKKYIQTLNNQLEIPFKLEIPFNKKGGSNDR